MGKPRAIAFFDLSNHYWDCKSAYGYERSVTDFVALAQEQSARLGYDLIEVRAFGGLISEKDNPDVHRHLTTLYAYQRRLAEERGVALSIKTLDLQTHWKDGGRRSEEMVDAELVLSIAFAGADRECEAMLIYSRDRDLAPAVTRVNQAAEKHGIPIDVWTCFPEERPGQAIPGSRRATFDRQIYDHCSLAHVMNIPKIEPGYVHATSSNTYEVHSTPDPIATPFGMSVPIAYFRHIRTAHEAAGEMTAAVSGRTPAPSERQRFFSELNVVRQLEGSLLPARRAYAEACDFKNGEAWAGPPRTLTPNAIEEAIGQIHASRLYLGPEEERVMRRLLRNGVLDMRGLQKIILNKDQQHLDSTLAIHLGYEAEIQAERQTDLSKAMSQISGLNAWEEERLSELILSGRMRGASAVAGHRSGRLSELIERHGQALARERDLGRTLTH